MNIIEDPQNIIETFLKDMIKTHCINVSVGTKASGKTNTMLALLRGFLDNKSFDEYHLVLPSYKYEQNNSYGFIKPYKDVKIYNMFHTLVIDRLINQQEKDNTQSILFIVDDATEMFHELWNPSQPLIALTTRSRHLNITTWLLCHSLSKILSPVLRQNVRYLLLYDIANKKLLDGIYEEYFSVDMTPKEFMEHWKKHRSVKYSCMLLRLGTDRALYYNFNELPQIEKYRKLNNK